MTMVAKNKLDKNKFGQLLEKCHVNILVNNIHREYSVFSNSVQVN